MTDARAGGWTDVGSGGAEPSGPQLARAVHGDVLTRPNSARMYDYWLGGKDNFAVDRRAADRVAAAQPLVAAGVRANRGFVRRAVAHLARSGVEQFLDVGSGLPTGENVHEVVGRINPAARTTYVDLDPVVLAHARALLATDFRTLVVEGDVREPDGFLAGPDLRAHLDLSRPVAVILAAILHLVTDAENPAGIVAVLREAMAPGSALVLTHVVTGGSTDLDAATRAGARVYAETTAPFVVRSRSEVAAWFTGFDLVPPGLVPAGSWRRRSTSARTAPVLAGVGLLPA